MITVTFWYLFFHIFIGVCLHFSRLLFYHSAYFFFKIHIKISYFLFYFLSAKWTEVHRSISHRRGEDSHMKAAGLLIGQCICARPCKHITCTHSFIPHNSTMKQIETAFLISVLQIRNPKHQETLYYKIYSASKWSWNLNINSLGSEPSLLTTMLNWHLVFSLCIYFSLYMYI